MVSYKLKDLKSKMQNAKLGIQILALMVPLCLFAQPLFSQHEHHQQHPQEQQQEAVQQQEGITLQELEQMAVNQNPTLIQADAALKAAQGAKQQAGLFPNPTVGIQVEELSQRDPAGNTEEHIFFFAEQTIPLGGKLGKAEKSQQWAENRAEIEMKMQRLRIINTVRSLYFQVLGAQQLVETQEKLQQLLQEASAITHELYNVGQADRPDMLEGEIEMQLAEVRLIEARSEHARLWQRLASVIGNSDLPVGRVAGNLEPTAREIDREKLLAKLLDESPAIHAAQASLEMSRAQVDAAKSLGKPDLKLRGGIGYNFEKIEDAGDPVGLEGFFEVGITLPVFNRNQGNVASASAGTIRAEQEIRRLRLSLSDGFAARFMEYEQAKSAAAKYGKEILPRAREAYGLYKNSFQQMGAAYPQVLIAQRNLYQAELEYVRSLVKLHTSTIQLENFLLAEGALDPMNETGESDGMNIPSAE